MADQDRDPSLDALGDRIAKAKCATTVQNGMDGSKGKGYAAAGRFISELVAGIAVGGFLGYYADSWLDTRPAFIIAGILLGMAGGIMNIYRAVSAEAKRDESDEKR